MNDNTKPKLIVIIIPFGYQIDEFVRINREKTASEKATVAHEKKNTPQPNWTRLKVRWTGH